MPIRRYGQHFLTDKTIIGKIVAGSGVTKNDAVLEIGPGRGILTRALAAAAKKVLTVEIDRRLHTLLEEEGLPANVELLRVNALELDGAALEASLGAEWKLIANLPYEITSKTLETFLPMRSRSGKGPTSVTLMLQKEVGERVTAKPGNMNRLALFCGYYSEPKILFSVPAGAFSPPPKVQSCVVRFEIRPTAALDGRQEQQFFKLITLGFSEKRRQLKNTLRSMLGDDASALLVSSGISPEARPEEVPPQKWITLAQKM